MADAQDEGRNKTARRQSANLPSKRPTETGWELYTIRDASERIATQDGRDNAMGLQDVVAVIHEPRSAVHQRLHLWRVDGKGREEAVVLFGPGHDVRPRSDKHVADGREEDVEGGQRGAQEVAAALPPLPPQLVQEVGEGRGDPLGRLGGGLLRPAVLRGQRALAEQEALVPDDAVLAQELVEHPEHGHAHLRVLRDEAGAPPQLVGEHHLLDPGAARPLVVVEHHRQGLLRRELVEELLVVALPDHRVRHARVGHGLGVQQVLQGLRVDRGRSRPHGHAHPAHAHCLLQGNEGGGAAGHAGGGQDLRRRHAQPPPGSGAIAGTAATGLHGTDGARTRGFPVARA
mmetsp:Transcript_59555/g.159580  ORF Transcript_59555/g.159580 Transcript_59555/m.159580 type:complete len:345 (+) Transcript_59555:121-1155(+)